MESSKEEQLDNECGLAEAAKEELDEVKEVKGVEGREKRKIMWREGSNTEWVMAVQKGLPSLNSSKLACLSLSVARSLAGGELTGGWVVVFLK